MISAATVDRAAVNPQGVFTRDFEMKEPGKNTITVNNYVNRGLRTNKTFSKVHKEFDIDW